MFGQQEHCRVATELRSECLYGWMDGWIKLLMDWLFGLEKRREVNVDFCYSAS